MKIDSNFVVVSLVAFLELSLLFEGAYSAPIVPPKFVYRADFRNPTSIFAEGFRHIGENTNVLEHVHGGSCSYGNNPSTAFVATTRDESFAEKWGIDQLWLDRFHAGPNYWVYKIRATSDFYDCFDSLMKGYKTSKIKEYKYTAYGFQHQSEWLAYHGVSPELIVNARMFEKDYENPPIGKFVRAESNPGYVHDDTEANSTAFNDPHLSKSKGIMSLLTSSISGLGACFGSSPSGHQSDAYSHMEDEYLADTGPTLADIVFQVNVTALKATVWDPIENGPRERTVPWEEETSVYGHLVEKPENCSVIPSTNGVNFLQISCSPNTFFDSLVITLKTGLGNHLLVSTHYMHTTASMFKKSAYHIPLNNGKGNLSHLKAGINEVFTRPRTGKHKGFWSEVKIYPIYPDYAQA